MGFLIIDLCKIFEVAIIASLIGFVGISNTSLHYPTKIHDSELRGQEEAGHMQQTSELFTCSTTVKLLIAHSNYVFRISIT